MKQETLTPKEALTMANKHLSKKECREALGAVGTLFQHKDADRVQLSMGVAYAMEAIRKLIDAELRETDGP